MNKAKVWYRNAKDELDSISIKEEQSFEIHDGYIRYGARKDQDTEVVAEILPMHRILSIEEYR